MTVPANSVAEIFHSMMPENAVMVRIGLAVEKVSEAERIRARNLEPMWRSKDDPKPMGTLPWWPNGREKEVLEKLADGLSTEEIAKELHLSPHTIKTYTQRMRRKARALNSVHLIHIAHEEGWLQDA